MKSLYVTWVCKGREPLLGHGAKPPNGTLGVRSLPLGGGEKRIVFSSKNIIIGKKIIRRLIPLEVQFNELFKIFFYVAGDVFLSFQHALYIIQGDDDL